MKTTDHIIRRTATVATMSIGILLALGFSVWMFGALAYDGPGAVTGGITMALLLGFMVHMKFRRRAWIVWVVCMAVGLIWWLALKPPADADWQSDVAKLATAEVDGDIVTFRNVRDFKYRSEEDYDPHWITRRVRFSSLTGVDIAINYWGSPWMAHPIVSFHFSDSPPLAFSIETRKRAGQSYSAIGGLYRQFPLICIVAEEQDILALRAVYRKDEDVYLYRTTLPAEHARTRLLEYVNTINTLSHHPRWYNAITTNCTTAIRSQDHDGDRIPWDWRILVNGKGDEMMFEIGKFQTDGLDFAQLKRRAHANAAIIAANGKPDFSARIRAATLPNQAPIKP